MQLDSFLFYLQFGSEVDGVKVLPDHGLGVRGFGSKEGLKETEDGFLIERAIRLIFLLFEKK